MCWTHAKSNYYIKIFQMTSFIEVFKTWSVSINQSFSCHQNKVSRFPYPNGIHSTKSRFNIIVLLRSRLINWIHCECVCIIKITQQPKQKTSNSKVQGKVAHKHEPHVAQSNAIGSSSCKMCKWSFQHMLLCDLYTQKNETTKNLNNKMLNKKSSWVN